MPEPQPPVDKGAITELVKMGAAQATPREVGNTPFVVIPNDHKIVAMRDYVFNENAATPQRKIGTALVHDADSFIEYVTLFRDPHSRVFADRHKSKFLAVLDYHESQAGPPRWGGHRADLTLQKSREWVLWNEKSGKQMDQATFAQFIEDNQPDIVNPSPASMLEMARDLSASSQMEFASQQRVSDGSTVFKFTEQVRANVGGREEAKVVDAFTIGIPVYFGSKPQELTARLRFRVHGGKLTFWYDLLRADVMEQDGFQLIAGTIAERLSVTIINGTPA